jgi:hypothetical protein
MSACHAGLLADHRTPVDSGQIIYASFYLYFNIYSFAWRPPCAGSLVSAFSHTVLAAWDICS